MSSIALHLLWHYPRRVWCLYHEVANVRKLEPLLSWITKLLALLLLIPSVVALAVVKVPALKVTESPEASPSTALPSVWNEPATSNVRLGQYRPYRRCPC